MASQDYQNIIKGLQPVEWNRNHPAADGEWITKNLLQPTHKKDEQLAKGLDNTIDRMSTFESKITTLTNTVSGAVQTVDAMASTVNEHTTEIETLDSEKQDKIFVDSSTIAGTGTSDDPYTVIGGGGGSNSVYVPSVENGQLNYNLSATSAAEATLGPWDIKGDKGDDGDPGKSPELSANNANIYWKYSDATSGWTDLGNFKGDTGDDGDPGKSPELSANNDNIYWKYSDATSGWTNLGNFKGNPGTPGEPGVGLSAEAQESSEARHTTVSIWEKGAETYDTQFDLPWGQDGYDPRITLTPIAADPVAEHKNGGTEVTITYGYNGSQTATYSAWNGNDGSVAGAPDIEGNNGISALYNGSKYLVGISGDYYSASNPSGFINGLFIAQYGTSTYEEVLAAYQKKELVQCVTGTKIATLGYVDNITTPTEFQFQYYRSPNSHVSEHHDKMYIYKLTPTGWGLQERPVIGYFSAGEGLSATWTTTGMQVQVTGAYATSAGLTGDDKQYAMTTNGWAEITGGGSSFTGAKTNNWVSGDGTSDKPIGLSAEATSAIEAMADQYQIDGGQYVSVVPNSTTHKVVVGLDNQATNAIADVIANADIWDAASAVSAKSHVTIDNTTNVITTENQGTSACLSAVEYKDNVNVAGMNVQQIYAVRNDDDIFACLSTTANKGTLFFVCSGVA